MEGQSSYTGPRADIRLRCCQLRRTLAVEPWPSFARSAILSARTSSGDATSFHCPTHGDFKVADTVLRRQRTTPESKQFLVCQCRQLECLGGELQLRRILGRSVHGSKLVTIVCRIGARRSRVSIPLGGLVFEPCASDPKRTFGQNLSPVSSAVFHQSRAAIGTERTRHSVSRNVRLRSRHWAHLAKCLLLIQIGHRHAAQPEPLGKVSAYMLRSDCISIKHDCGKG